MPSLRRDNSFQFCEVCGRNSRGIFEIEMELVDIGKNFKGEAASLKLRFEENGGILQGFKLKNQEF